MGNSFCAFGERSEPPNRTSTMLKRPELEEALSDYMNNTLKIEGNKVNEAIKSKFKKEDFEVLKPIGRGACGKISLVKKIDSGERFAMKTIKKSTITKKNLMEYTLNEKDILKNNSNPYIVDLYYAFQDEENIYLALEFVQGGDLYTHLNMNGNLPESRARLYSAELVDALIYLHSKGIIYRDLKPENILVGLDGHLKIVDFGFAKILQKNEKCDTLCGTPQYVAPEILLRNTYDDSVDWWNLGCVIYEMLVGVNPFFDKSIEIILKNIVEKRLELPINLSKNSKNLIEGLLQKNPEKRLTAKKIKDHPFFKGIDWKKVSTRQMEIDFIPIVDGKEDMKYFENVNLDETARNEHSMAAHENYADFSYAKH